MQKPPQIALKLLRWFCKSSVINEIEGDLLEMYAYRQQRNSKHPRLRFWMEILASMNLRNMGIMEKNQDQFLVRQWAMLNQYRKIFTRLLLRYKIYSTISIASLAIGLSSAIMVHLYLQKELTFDRHLEDANLIYRVAIESQNSGRSYAFAPTALTPTLIDTYESVTDGVRIFKYRRPVPITVKQSRQSFNEPYFGWVDPSFFQVFSISFEKGNPNTALNRPNTIVISSSTAKKYFGNEDPIGKIIEYNWTENSPLEVTGVFEDIPTNTHFHFDMLSSLETCQKIMWNRPLLNAWQNLFTSAYIKIKPGTADEVAKFVDQEIQENFAADSPNTINSWLQPITTIHLQSKLDLGEWKENNNLQNLLIFGAIGLIILVLGCFNFVNMITAQATQRTKEVGIRKVLGSQKRFIAQQTFIETVFYVMIASLASGLIVTFSLPLLEKLTQHQYTWADINNPQFYLPLLLIWLIVILLSGSYPALYISRFNSLRLISGGTGSESSKKVRKLLIITQFTLAIGLVICTLMVYLQLDYMRNKSLGFDHSLIINMPIHNDEAILPKLDLFRDEVVKHPGLSHVTAASHEMFADYTYIGLFRIAGSDESHRWERFTTDQFYPQTFDLPLLAGRYFDQKYQSDTSAFLLNKKAVETLGLTPAEAIGQTIEDEASGVSGKIVGVLDNFHFRSLHHDIQPFVLYVNRGRLDYISARMSNANYEENIGQLESTWKDVFGDQVPFFYSFLDQKAEALYVKETNEGMLFTIFSGISILLGCMSLFGFALFLSERKYKEIGIRKVLGATRWQILKLMNGSFISIITIALTLSIPLAYYLMNLWLDGFAFRIEQPLWIYGITVLMMFLIALSTVSFLALKAAQTNPVDAIKSE